MQFIRQYFNFQLAWISPFANICPHQNFPPKVVSRHPAVKRIQVTLVYRGNNALQIPGKLYVIPE